MSDEIRQVEQRLRAAMLAGDVTALDALIDDTLMFIGPDSRVYAKDDDLENYRSGRQTISRIDVKELRIETHGDTAVAMVLADMAGGFLGHGFDGTFRYLRTWSRASGQWQIIAGSVCAAQ